jgi:serine/threonine protein kinase
MPELKLEHSLVDNRYEVLERLSRGSFAEIFVARDREAGGMEVVIKALNTSLQGTPDADLERTLIENFQNEALALDAVRHPHVILRWGHGTAADLRGTPFHYLVLEYMPGGDLLKLCRARPNNALSLSEALFYFQQACEALAYAHSKGIIHRDLKPNNFLLTADHKAMKIADFGVAKIASGEETEITRVGADIYAPPEHHPNEVIGEITGGEASARNRLTASADIYSLAKSFYTVVCGRPPSQFKCDPITYLPDGLMSEPVKQRLLAVLRRATDDDPQARYPSVAEFWSDLAQVACGEEEKIDEARDAVDETTIIRPRLNIAPVALPGGPAQPDFDPTLASARPRVSFSTATLVEKPMVVQNAAQEGVAKDNNLHPPRAESQTEPKQNDRYRSPKFFIELQERPSPDIKDQARGEPLAPQRPRSDTKPQVKTESKSASHWLAAAVSARPTKPQVKTESKSAAKTTRKMVDKFNRKARRNIFIGLLIFTLLGVMVSVDKYIRRQNLPFGFGPATEIEILTEKLNVREAPPRGKILGTVAKGSRHRVIEQLNQNWFLIQVGQWSERELGFSTDQGWVYGDLDGNSPKVRVVSRKFWW